MERTYIKSLSEKVGTQVLVKGFVQTVRNQGSIKFLILRDVTGLVQNVILKSHPDVFSAVADLSTESVVEIIGLVKAEKQAPGGFEIEATSLTLISKALPELPIPVVVEKGGEETEMNKRLDWRWIDLRKAEKLKIFKVWNALEDGFREYLKSQNFMQIYTPSFMSAPSESGAEVFEVEYFGKKAYLSQSPQFYKQMAMASGMERVFITNPVYRAEPSYTTRHVTEFTGFDFEMSYATELEDIMRMEENMIVAGFKKVNEILGEGTVEIPSLPFPQITMAEAKQKLKAAGIVGEKEHDMNATEEVELSKIIKVETGHDFVFLRDWNAKIRAFYHMRYADRPDTSISFDLLYKGLEITTGALREHNPEKLEQQAEAAGISAESIQDYLSFFKYGCPPHGGVGIGPSRIVMKMLDLPNVKEAIFLPRDVKRLTP